jgi:hypothetical protein
MIQQRGLAPSRSQAHPVIIAGVLVGILDILAAFVVRYWLTRASPVRVLQGIASGLLGALCRTAHCPDRDSKQPRSGLPPR